MTTKTSDFHLYIGDYAYFMGMKFHLNMAISLFFSITVLSHIIHYYNYLCCRGEPYMKVFFMMSGQTTPHSIGLYDERGVKDILKKSRIAFKLLELIRLSVVVLAFLISFSSFLLKVSSLNTVLIALLHSSIKSLTAHYVSNIICSQISYFYIICYYLKLKQREVNNYLRKVIKNKERIKIFYSNQIVKFNKIYEEIKQCDSIFWSKFLAPV